MTENVLTREEVDAILNITQENQSNDLSTVLKQDGSSTSTESKPYAHALSSIHELTINELENDFSAFLRKQLFIKYVNSQLITFSSVMNDESKKYIYSTFRLKPSDSYGIIFIDYTLLHHSINMLFGGNLNKSEPVISTPGHTGIIVTHKLCEHILSSFTKGCAEFTKQTHEILKTTGSINLASNIGINNDDYVYSIELKIILDEIESHIQIILDESFLNKSIPAKLNTKKHIEKDFWRDAIKTQVVDSLVTVTANLQEVKIKFDEFTKLKDGDIIEITDPTLAYICLNDLKLFKATAGQSDDKRVIKIISQV